jgi:hypothetical protein
MTLEFLAHLFSKKVLEAGITIEFLVHLFSKKVLEAGMTLEFLPNHAGLKDKTQNLNYKKCVYMSAQ